MKVDDYNLSKLSNEAENFKEDVSNIINFGKYSSQVVSAAPTWKARNGEFVFFASGTVKRIYFYNLSAWDFIEYDAGATGGQITAVKSADQTYGGSSIITELTFAMGASETWTSEFHVWHETNGGNAAGSNFSINGPGGSSVRALYLAVESAGKLINADVVSTLAGDSSLFFTKANDAEQILKISISIATSTSAGSLTFSAVRGDASNTGIVKNGSYLVARKEL